jgi:hypothetical protein
MPTDDEIIDAANKFFRSIGGAVKKGATTAVKAGQAVVGVGRGAGRRELRVRAGMRKVTVARLSRRRAPAGGRAARQPARCRDREAWHATATMPGKFEHELPARPVPPGAFARVASRARWAVKPAMAGRLGDVARAVSAVVAPTTGPIEWRVIARLVVPMARDLEHAVDVMIDGVA